MPDSGYAAALPGKQILIMKVPSNLRNLTGRVYPDLTGAKRPKPAELGGAEPPDSAAKARVERVPRWQHANHTRYGIIVEGDGTVEHPRIGAELR